MLGGSQTCFCFEYIWPTVVDHKGKKMMRDEKGKTFDLEAGRGWCEKRKDQTMPWYFWSMRAFIGCRIEEDLLPAEVEERPWEALIDLELGLAWKCIKAYLFCLSKYLSTFGKADIRFLIEMEMKICLFLLPFR